MNPYQALFDLSDRSAVVYGAASGIGEACARMLAGLGADVICADVDDAGLEATVDRITSEGGRASGLRTDLTVKDEVREVIDFALERHGRFDIGVTTPGINIRRRVADYTDEEFDRIVSLNLRGTFWFLQQASMAMAERGGGSLIACSSMRANLVEPGLAVYASTKSAIQQLVRGLASEVGARGVRVNSIAPGVIDTPLTRPLRDVPEVLKAYDEHTILGRWGTTDEVASAVAFLASDAASYITGTNLPIDAGWTAIDGRFDPQR